MTYDIHHVYTYVDTSPIGRFFKSFKATFGGFCTTVFDEIAVFGHNVWQLLQELTRSKTWKMASTVIRVHVIKKEGSSGWFFHKVTTENTTINDVYEDICLKGLNFEPMLPKCGYYTNHQCFILDQRLICVSIFLFNTKCTVKKKKQKKKTHTASTLKFLTNFETKYFFLA